jgi:hypothetical protein
VDVLVQEEPVIPKEKEDCNHEGEDGNENSSALDWEAQAAGSILGEFGCADAHAAAALVLDWW